MAAHFSGTWLDYQLKTKESLNRRRVTHIFHDPRSSLLRQGARPDTPLPERCTPLHLAASKGHTAVIQLLLSAGARVNMTCNGLTPLHYAIMSGEKPAAKVKEAVKVLLEGGADISAEARGHGSPIQTARTQGAHSSSSDSSTTGNSARLLE